MDYSLDSLLVLGYEDDYDIAEEGIKDSNAEIIDVDFVDVDDNGTSDNILVSQINQNEYVKQHGHIKYDLGERENNALKKNKSFLKRILNSIKNFFMKIGAIFSKKLSAKLLAEKIDSLPDKGYTINKKMFLKALALQKKGYSEAWQAVKDHHRYGLKKHDITYTNAFTGEIESGIRDENELAEIYKDYDDLDKSYEWGLKYSETCTKNDLKKMANEFCQNINNHYNMITSEKRREINEAKKVAESANNEKQNIFVKILTKIWKIISFIPRMIARGIKNFLRTFMPDYFGPRYAIYGE